MILSPLDKNMPTKNQKEFEHRAPLDSFTHAITHTFA